MVPLTGPTLSNSVHAPVIVFGRRGVRGHSAVLQARLVMENSSFEFSYPRSGFASNVSVIAQEVLHRTHRTHRHPQNSPP